MSLITWNTSYAVGVAEIDTQHQKLVDLINKLHDAMKAGKSNTVLGGLLSDLVSYTGYHFATEEKYFDKFHYAESPAHRAEHRKLVAEVVEFQKKFKSGAASISMDLMEFLKKWLTDHIAGSDRKYVACFKENGLK